MTIKVPREWQAAAFSRWQSVGMYGLIKARTGAGKTLAGCLIAQQYHQLYPFSKMLVAVPSAKIGQQWKQELSAYGISDIPVMSYEHAINLIRVGKLHIDCLIADECHRLSPEKQSSQIMKANPMHVLGLSATPSNSEKVLGKPFYTVDWEEADLCDFRVHYVFFTPETEDMKKYKKLSSIMCAIASETTGGARQSLQPGRSSKYDVFVRKRRNLCYTFQSRIMHTVHLIQMYAGKKRIVVYTERVSQIEEIADELDCLGLEFSVFSDCMDTLADFEAHKTDILLLCKKLREGWNDPTLEVEILCATTTAELQHTQVVGRVQRKDPANPSKIAHIFVLVAKGTSDENVLENEDFPPQKVEQTTIGEVLDVGPGLTARQMVNCRDTNTLIKGQTILPME